jgi:hypothetical protein
MAGVVKAWERARLPTALLEEGLQILASDKRPTADTLCRLDSPSAAVTCTYGKGARAKLTLPKEDASFMLGFVAPIRRAAPTELAARKMVLLASGILFEDQSPPTTLRDPSWDSLLSILADIAPAVRQATLF